MTTNSSPTESASTQPGPSILEERSLLGIFIHFIAIFPLFGLVIAGITYTVSNREFTRANARNAFDWNLFVDGLFLGSIVLLFGLDALLEAVGLAGAIETAVIFPAFLLVFAAMSLHGLKLLLWIVAMAKAIFGEAWRYPLAPELM